MSRPVIVDVQTSVWDILTAIGTVGAAVVAVSLAALEIRARRQAESERDALRAEQRRSQATRVVVRLVKLPVSPVGPASLLQKDAVLVRNDSDLPIFLVRPSVFVRYTGATGPTECGEVAVIPARSEQEFAPEEALPPHIDAARLEVTITFRDAAGAWWRRYDHGVLDEYDPEPPATRPADIVVANNIVARWRRRSRD